MNCDAFPDKKAMDEINRLTKREMTKDEVYVFNITLCNNEIDRDFEVFDEKSLEKLGELFKGKTGISDHSMRSCDQTARIYRTWLERIPGKKTSYGADFVSLKASAYMVRTTGNEDLIKEIDAGIKKEVSISCSVKENICSVCGKDVTRKKCEHIKGRKYNGKTCYTVLSEPTDAYEWSFVAVPAQKEAGVTKAFITQKEEAVTTDIKEILKSADITMDEKQKSSILSYIEQLERKAEDGEKYRSDLIAQVKSLALLVLPEINSKTFSGVCSNMSTKELCEFRDGLMKKKNAVLPLTPQLSNVNKSKKQNNSEYKI